MTADQIEELWARFVAGELADPQQRELRQEFDANPALLDQLVQDWMLTGVLRQLGRAAADRDTFAGQVGQRLDKEQDKDHFVARVTARLAQLSQSGQVRLGKRSWLRVAAVAACLLVAFMTWFFWPRSSIAPPRLVQVDGTVWRLDGASKAPMEVGIPIAEGQGVEVGKGRAVVEFHDQTRLELGSGTMITQLADSGQGKRVTISHGQVTAHVSAQPGNRPMVLTTPQAEVKVLGTSLLVSCSTNATSMAVTEGKVRMTSRQDQSALEVLGGSCAVVGGGGVWLGLLPEADAHVRDGKFAEQNFGTAPELVVKDQEAKSRDAHYSREAFLGFDLSGLPDNITSARLRLYPTEVEESKLKHAVALAAGPWSERTITWKNKPPAGPALTTWSPVQGQPVEIDVTQQLKDALKGDRKLSFKLYSFGGSYTYHHTAYGSREEANLMKRPMLLIQR